MAQSQKISSITIILATTMAALYGGAMAQSLDCTIVLVNLSPCLSYTSGNTSTPSSGCCTQLGSAAQSQPECLCQVLNGGSSFAISINETRALALPSACNVQTPPTSQCNAPSPGNSPSESTPSGKGTNNGSSGASSTTFATIPIVFGLLVAAHSMVF